jgi:hypothetical protein
MNIRKLTILAALFVLPNLTVAQDAEVNIFMRPGLWEVNSKIDATPGMQAGQSSVQGQAGATAANSLLDRLSPSQRSFLEGIFQKRGIQIQGNGNGVQRVCVSPVMSAAHEFPFTRSDCQQSQSKQSQTITTTFSCSNPVSKGSLTATIITLEAYTLALTAEGTTSAEKLSMSSQGKFISPDCGAIRPAR